MFYLCNQGSQRDPRTWEGENGRVLTGVLFGVRLLQESRKDRLALFSVTGDRATRRFFCRLSTEGGVPMPEPPTSVLGEMGISSPRLLRLRSEIVWPSSRYSVMLGPGVAVSWDDSACSCCCDVWGCTGLLLTLPSADGSSGRSNLLKSHQASGSCQRGRVESPNTVELHSLHENIPISKSVPYPWDQSLSLTFISSMLYVLY